MEKVNFIKWLDQPVSNIEVSILENRLGITFSACYREFISNFSHLERDDLVIKFNTSMHFFAPTAEVRVLEILNYEKLIKMTWLNENYFSQINKVIFANTVFSVSFVVDVEQHSNCIISIADTDASTYALDLTIDDFLKRLKPPVLKT